jgi:hypothetical protein
MERIARIMEVFWLALAVLAAGWVGWMFLQHGWEATRIYVWFPLVCLAMFFYRRFTRRKMAEWAARQAAEEAVRKNGPAHG